MDVVVKEGGDATTGSSSRTMLLVGLSLVAAVAGGVAIWWFFFRKKKDDGDGGGPPKRENMKWAPGYRGIVGVLPDCKVLEGASDYAQAGYALSLTIQLASARKGTTVASAAYSEQRTSEEARPLI